MRSLAFLLFGLTLIVLALAGAWAVDHGITRPWTESARFAWALGLFLCILLGVAGVIEGIFPDEEAEEPGDEHEDVDGDGDISLGFRHVAYGGLALCALVTLAFAYEQRTGFGLDRSLLILAGLGLAAITWYKPSWFWQQERARRLRSLLGDASVAALYFGIAAGFVAFGLLRRPVDPLADLLPIGALSVERFRASSESQLEVVEASIISIRQTGDGGYLIDGGTTLPDLTGLEITAPGESVITRFGRIGNRSELPPVTIGSTGTWHGTSWSLFEIDSLRGDSSMISFAIARDAEERRGLIYLQARLLEDSIITHGFNFVTFELEQE